MAAKRLITLLVADFADFVLHEKRWWLTILIVVIAVLVGLIVINERQAVRPFIYTNY